MGESSKSLQNTSICALRVDKCLKKQEEKRKKLEGKENYSRHDARYMKPFNDFHSLFKIRKKEKIIHHSFARV